MTCLSCQSVKQAELTAEMLVHFPGLKHLEQTWRFVIPEARSLLRLRLFSVYRPGDRIGVGCKSYLTN